MTPPLQAMAVVLPAHNEEALLGGCLQSVRPALDGVDLPRVVVVVLDRCTDTSRSVVRRHCSHLPVVMVEGTFNSVGAARDAGLARAALHFPHLPATRIWVANTDADSMVPAHWLAHQRRLADSGADMVLGTVEPGPPDHDPVRKLWLRHHTLAEGHDHIHGANLGIRLSEVLRVGGFGDLGTGEDVSLARRVQEGNDAWVATDTTRVITSSRRRGRAREGFAAYLRSLEESISTVDLGADPRGGSGVSER